MRKYQVVCLILLLSIILSSLGSTSVMRSKTSAKKTKNMVLPVQVELKNTPKVPGWQENNTTLLLEHYDNCQTINSTVAISFQIYIPKSLLSKKGASFIIRGGCHLSSSDYKYIGYIDSKNDYRIYKDKKKYRVTYWNGKKDVSAGKNAVVKTVGKYLSIKIKNSKLQGIYNDAEGKAYKAKGINANYSPSFVMYSEGIKKKTDLYLDNVKMISGKKVLVKDNFSSCECDNLVILPGERYVSRTAIEFDKKKVVTNKTVKSNHILDASDEEFVSLSSEEATKNQISSQLKEKASKLPEMQAKDVSKWCGMHINNLMDIGGTINHGIPHFYTEDEVSLLSNEGFNCLRIHFDLRVLFSKNALDNTCGIYYKGEGDRVNLRVLKNIDDLISWAIKYDIHILFDAFNMPGGYICGIDPEYGKEMYERDSKAQNIFYDFWELMAKRYSDISSAVLSFNLINEPPHIFEKDDYIYMINKAISRIQKWDEERIIVVDMHNYGTEPIEEISGKKIVQSIHPYDPREFTTPLSPESISYTEESGKAVREQLSIARDFQERTGTPVIIGEFNCAYYQHMEDALKYYNDVLSTAKEFNLGWILYGDGGEMCYENYSRKTWRKGGTYVAINNNGVYISKEIRKLFKSYMK